MLAIERRELSCPAHNWSRLSFTSEECKGNSNRPSGQQVLPLGPFTGDQPAWGKQKRAWIKLLWQGAIFEIPLFSRHLHNVVSYMHFEDESQSVGEREFHYHRSHRDQVAEPSENFVPSELLQSNERSFVNLQIKSEYFFMVWASPIRQRLLSHY